MASIHGILLYGYASCALGLAVGWMAAAHTHFFIQLMQLGLTSMSVPQPVRCRRNPLAQQQIELPAAGGFWRCLAVQPDGLESGGRRPNPPLSQQPSLAMQWMEGGIQEALRSEVTC